MRKLLTVHGIITHHGVAVTAGPIVSDATSLQAAVRATAALPAAVSTPSPPAPDSPSLSPQRLTASLHCHNAAHRSKRRRCDIDIDIDIDIDVDVLEEWEWEWEWEEPTLGWSIPPELTDREDSPLDFRYTLSPPDLLRYASFHSGFVALIMIRAIVTALDVWCGRG